MQQADEKQDNMQCNDRKSPVIEQGLRSGQGPQPELGGGSRVFSLF